MDAGHKASIYGTGLSGSLTVKIGNREPQYVKTTGTSDTYAEFIVPNYQQTIEAGVSVTNSSGSVSNSYTVRIIVPEIAQVEISESIDKFIQAQDKIYIDELHSVVEEVRVFPGGIKVDDALIKTAETKILVNIGKREVSVEPSADKVFIRDKDLSVIVDDVLIKQGGLSVGGVKVNISASEIVEKFSLSPKTIELKKVDNRAVYNIVNGERRKLFGFIRINIEKIVTIDADNAEILQKRTPWYRFLTTRY